MLLVRHCQTTGQSPDAELTALGRAQAEELAAFLAGYPVDHVVTSPFRRARDSIAPFAARSALVPMVDDRLAERRIAWTADDGWRDVVRRSFEDLDHGAPDNETGRAALDRARAAVRDALAQGHRLPVLVGHGQLFALVLHAIDPTFGFAGHAAMTNPDVFQVDRDLRRFARVWGGPAGSDEKVAEASPRQ
jgi:2,3-bisphosphoglycerate-dependent phosphoglycerate mutase